MGLLDIFKSKKTNYRVEMIEYVRSFMLSYIKEFPTAADAVIPIFSNANEMLKSVSEKDIRKMMESNRVNVECGALNIIQNFAMTELKPQSAVSFLKGENYPFALYNYINERKYNKGYISKQQYDENAMLATKLSIHSPLGGWF